MRFFRKNWPYIFIALFFIILFLFYLSHFQHAFQHEKIKVGILFSSTGTMADSEQPVINATLLAIDEINQHGGINKKQIVPIIYDGESNWKKYAELAKKMIEEDHVKVIFGCWTSASRKEVKPIVERYNNLLIYPTQYEGIEESNNIIYLGPTPNQQIIPAVSWIFQHHGKRIFLVGSDYIFPHVANEILFHDIKSLGGEIVGEKYIPLGSSQVDDVIKEIIKQKPDAVFNTINGNTNIAFFNRLYELTHGEKKFSIVSFSLSNADRQKIGIHKLIGDYSSWSYFRALENPENKSFLQAYQAKYGDSKQVNDPAATEYAGVYLWAQAMRESPSENSVAIRNFMLRQSIASPAGIIYIDQDTAHAWRTVMLGKVNTEGNLAIIWSSHRPIQPIVYPEFKSRAEWDLFEYQLYTDWNKSWENNQSKDSM